MANLGFWSTVRREVNRMASRKMYLFMMVVVPVTIFLFFTGLLAPGLPLKVPTAIVDLDHTPMSRKVTRSLNAGELVDISEHLESYSQAMASVRRGDIFGFFIIPADFEKDVLSGKKPTLEYYSNLTYFVPGTLSFKGFKTAAVTVTGGMVVTTLTTAGVAESTVGSLIQPVAVQDHPIGNPWLSYSIYLCNSFAPGVLALMVMMVTVFSIGDEMKRGTSVAWLARNGGSMVLALFGKLAPQTVIFTATGVAMQAIFYGFNDFPLNNHAWHIVLAMFLLVAACQAFAVTIIEIVPNLRLALSMVSLVGILSFSITGFSFPVQNMYGGVAIFSYLIPLRYYFLIYVDQALNGIDIYYSRWFYIVLAMFLLLPLAGLRRLRKRCENPIYIK